MQEMGPGVIVEISDAVVLKKLIDTNNKGKKSLTKTDLKNLKIQEPQLHKLITGGFVKEEIGKRTNRYLISEKCLETFNSLPQEIKEAAGKKKSLSAKPKKSEEIAALNSRIDAIDKKIDQILNILKAGQGNGKNTASDDGDKLDSFKKTLVEEYKKLARREFLLDGKVWHDQLKRIMMDRQGYKDYEYDELLQRLKETNIGMVSLSQGKDKIWIEIRA